jgi:bacillithiol biosynthesis deacetylase BshB1
MSNKVDILAVGAHPDDVELACSGTLIKEIKAGKKVAIVDLTQGELGTRGSGELRLEEAAAASKVIGAEERVNLDMGDGFFEVNKENKLRLITQIRRFRPQVMLINAKSDRHIDHERGGKLAHDAAFLSGLRRIETEWEGEIQQPWRPPMVFHYIQYFYRQPDFVVDISAEHGQKVEAIKAFKSQFYDPDSNEPISPIATKAFMEFVTARSREMGSIIQKEFGEGFNTVSAPEIELLSSLGN